MLLSLKQFPFFLRSNLHINNFRHYRNNNEKYFSPTMINELLTVFDGRTNYRIVLEIISYLNLSFITVQGRRPIYHPSHLTPLLDFQEFRFNTFCYLSCVLYIVLCKK